MTSNGLSQKPSEKLELVQKARLGPGHDSEATVLNRCVPYSDSGLSWEADPRHAGLAVAELELQAVRPQTGPDGAKPNAPQWPRGNGASQTESTSQRVSKSGIPSIRPTRHRVCLQGVQPRS